MAAITIPCSINLTITCTTTTTSLPACSTKLSLRNGFLGTVTTLSRSTFNPTSSMLGPTCGGRATCWFKIGPRDAEGAGIYGSQSRDDFDRDDVEQYFNYMGMLAVEGSYDKMEALLNQNIHPVDILLLMAATEGDQPKIEELLRAGAKYDVKDADGNTALDRASDEIRDFILNFRVR